MCKTKKSTNATNPSPSLRAPPRRPSSSSGPSSSTTRSATTASSAIGSSKTSASTSSATSLSSIRSSLPENSHIYNFSEIASATNNFLSKRRLPSSNSSAWRCSLSGKDVVVFQRRPRRRLPDLRPLLSSLCKCHHSSIINLLGASLSADHMYLVYDFVPGASLSAALRNANNPSFTLLPSWLSRLQVAADLADGLHYIHRSSGLNLVHNHLKSSSIILSDPLLHAKICHFGTALLTGESPDAETAESQKALEPSSSSSSALRRSNSRVTRVQGTVGYMAPEVSMAGILSQKSDVYSFGVVILELLSGEEPMKFRYDKATKDLKPISVIESAREAIEGRLRQWVDRRLKDSFPVEVAERMIRVALDCVHVDPDQRPDMERVSGKVSRMLIESNQWADKMKVPTDFSVSMGPR